MHLAWSILYRDSATGKGKFRTVYLDTNSLSPVDKASVEYIMEISDVVISRKLVKYRHLFKEEQGSLPNSGLPSDGFRTFELNDYIEDENGNELPPPIDAYSEDGFLDHNKLREHIALEFNEHIHLSEEDYEAMCVFATDFNKLTQEALFREGPGELTLLGRYSQYRSAVTHEEIRSFVMIFRKLYMEKEPGQFVKVARSFLSNASNHPLRTLVSEHLQQYEELLRSEKPYLFYPFACTPKHLIDVVINTQYAHQPQGKRLKQLNTLLEQCEDSEATITWCFLQTIRTLSTCIFNAGRSIVNWFDQYCQYHSLPGVIGTSLYDSNLKIGKLETREARRNRSFREKAEKLAYEIWKSKGQPAGGFAQFIDEAQSQLRSSLGES